jgi:hypothetical protein
MNMRQTLVALLVLAFPRAAFACPVCFGQSDSPMALATNMGVFFMLGVTTAVLAAFAAFFIYLIRRANAVAEGDSPAAAGSHVSEGTARC